MGATLIQTDNKLLDVWFFKESSYWDFSPTSFCILEYPESNTRQMVSTSGCWGAGGSTLQCESVAFDSRNSLRLLRGISLHTRNRRKLRSSSTNFCSAANRGMVARKMDASSDLYTRLPGGVGRLQVLEWTTSRCHAYCTCTLMIEWD
jgi:hypothetical protein